VILGIPEKGTEIETGPDSSVGCQFHETGVQFSRRGIRRQGNISKPVFETRWGLQAPGKADRRAKISEFFLPEGPPDFPGRAFSSSMN
jgi:hypothetical protein